MLRLNNILPSSFFVLSPFSGLADLHGINFFAEDVRLISWQLEHLGTATPWHPHAYPLFGDTS